jgi:hypothetical protein
MGQKEITKMKIKKIYPFGLDEEVEQIEWKDVN